MPCIGVLTAVIVAAGVPGVSFASTGIVTLNPVVTLALSATAAGATPFTVTVTVAVLLPTLFVRV